MRPKEEAPEFGAIRGFYRDMRSPVVAGIQSLAHDMRFQQQHDCKIPLLWHFCQHHAADAGGS